jgi:pyruvate/2-oxoglutarate dehydrogenase complex dihydrolipoamide dehydrogenase (E3) component
MAPDKAASTPEGPASLTRVDADVCVIGGGPGGLAVATGAAAFGRRVVLVEKDRLGGNSAVSGSVPSHALLAAAHRAHLIRSCAAFGIAPTEPAIDFAAVHRHVRSIVEDIGRTDSAARFRALGIQVIQAPARFTGPSTVAAGDFLISARRIVIATGSVPVIPPIAGLDSIRYFTNETIFENSVLPEHLIIAGAGPFGIEMAQAHRRLGARVTVLDVRKALPRYDPEMSGRLLDLLRREGVEIREGVGVTAVQPAEGGFKAELSGPKGMESIQGSCLLLATGRQPNVSGLALSAAGIRFDKSGISVDAGLRTSNRKVFAIGDAAGGPAFTHVAEHHAATVLRRILFRMPAKVTADLVPWVTFTAPELAQIGTSEAVAAARNIRVRILRWPFRLNDRALTERAADGHVKVVTDRRGRILGASILGAGAGELIQVWSLAISEHLNIRDMAGSIPPYPTFGDVNRRTALRFFTDSPANPLLRRLTGWLAKLG